MKTESRAKTSIPYSPAPTPPGETSPSIMFTSGTAPPPGVKLSWAAMTAPVEVPVVEAANRPEAAAPNRTSLPSMFARGRIDPLGCRRARSPWRRRPSPIQRTNIAAKIAQPWRWSPTIRPNA